MRCTWTLPVLIASACVALLSGCPIPFGYYSAGNEQISQVLVTDNSNFTAVSTVVSHSTPASGGDPVEVSGTQTIDGDQVVSLDSPTPDASIYYCTIPGCIPNPYSPTTVLDDPAHPIKVANGSTITISAVAFKALMLPSAISTLTLTIEYIVSGTITAQVYTAAIWGFHFCDVCMDYTYIADGTYTVYCGAIAADSPFVSNTPASKNLSPDQIFLPGWQKYELVDYVDYSGGSAIPFTIGVPGAEPVVVAAFIDWDNDKLVSTDSASLIVDPIATYGNAGVAGFPDSVKVTFSQDTSGVDLTFPSAPN